MLFVLFVLIGVTVSAPASNENGMSDVIKDANEAKKELSGLGEAERQGVFIIMGILGNSTLSDIEKKSLISNLMKNATKDEQAQVDKIVNGSLQFNSWLASRLKSEKPEVQTAVKSIVSSLTNMNFLMSTDAEKKAQLDKIVAGLSADDIAAMKKIDQESKTKEKELGLDEK